MPRFGRINVRGINADNFKKLKPVYQRLIIAGGVLLIGGIVAIVLLSTRTIYHAPFVTFRGYVTGVGIYRAADADFEKESPELTKFSTRLLGQDNESVLFDKRTFDIKCPLCFEPLDITPPKCRNKECQTNTDKDCPPNKFDAVECYKCERKLLPYRCKNAYCRAPIKWGKIKCDFCRGTGKCEVCIRMGQVDEMGNPTGKCYNCYGKVKKDEGGYMMWGSDCPNCAVKQPDGTFKSEGKCPVCRGSANCDFCNGAGWFTPKELKDKGIEIGAIEEKGPELPGLPK